MKKLVFLILCFLFSQLAAAQQIRYNQPGLYDSSISELVFVDSTTVLGLGGYDDYYLKSFVLNRLDKGQNLLPYKVEKIAYNPVDKVVAAIPYNDYENPGHETRLKIMDVQGQERVVLPAQNDAVFSKDGRLLFGVDTFNRIRAYDWKNGSIIDSTAWQRPVQKLYAIADSSVLIYDYQPDKHSLWTWHVHGVAHKLYQPEHTIKQILPAEKFVVITEEVEKVEFYRRMQITVVSYEGKILQQWVEGKDAENLVLDDKGNLLAATDYLGHVKLWKNMDGQFKPINQGLDGLKAEGIGFSRQENMLVMVGINEVSFFSLTDFAVIETISFPNYDRSFSGTLSASPSDNNYAFAFNGENFKAGLMVVNFDGEKKGAEIIAPKEESSQAKAAVVLQSGHQSAISSMVFGKDDRYLFSGDEDGKLIKWDLKSGLHFEPLNLFGQDEVYTGGYSGSSSLGLAYNKATNELAVISESNPSLPILDAETMRIRFKIPVNELPRHPVYSNDGKLFAFEEDTTLKIYAVGSSQYTLLHAIAVPNSVNDLVFSPENNELIAADVAHEIQVIDVQRGAVIQTLTGHEDAITSLEFSPDMLWLYSVDLSSNIWRWNAKTFAGELFYKSTYSGGAGITMEKGKLIQHLVANDIHFSKDGSVLYSTGTSKNAGKNNELAYTILAWNVETKKPVKNFSIDQKSDPIQAFAISSNGGLLATGGTDQTVRLWNTQSARLQRSFGNPIPEIKDAIAYYQKDIILGTQSNSEGFYRLQRWNIPELKIDQSLDGVPFGTNNLVLDEAREMVGAEFGGTHTWMSFENISDSVSFAPSTYYSRQHASPEGAFLFGYRINDKKDDKGFSIIKNISVDVYNTQTQKKAYTITANGVVLLDLTNFIPRFDTEKNLFALQTDRDKITLYDYHTGAQKKVIALDKPIQNFRFGGGSLYLWHEDAIEKVNLQDNNQSTIQTLSNSVYDPDRNLAAVSNYNANNQLAWVSQIKEELQVGRTKTFGLNIFNTKTNQLQEVPLLDVPQKLFFSDEDKKVVAVFKNYLSFYDTANAHLIGSMVPVGTDDYFFYTPDFYYSSSRDAYAAVGFQFKNQMISFDQLDLWYNRPDIVLSRMQMVDQTNIDLVHEAYTKRLNQAGFAEETDPDLSTLPSIQFAEDMPSVSSDKKITFMVEAEDTLHPLESLHLYANGVPVWGQKGKAVTGHDIRLPVEMELLAGHNKIQVSARNELGFESLRETREIIYNPPEKVKSDLYLISVNVSNYLSDNDLQYARKDGRDLISLYANKSAYFYDTIYVDTLFDEQATLEKIIALKQKLLNTHPEDQVILFISGHGLLDKDYNFYFATYDTDFSKPSERGISYEKIEWLLDGIPARRKLLLIDACHSGEVDKGNVPDEDSALAKNVITTFKGAKGVGSFSTGNVGVENSFTLMQELFANLNRGSGTVVISAAAGNSYALESDEWRNGIFTYSILDGLKNMHADENKDGSVTVSELRQFVYKKVVEETGGRQKPTTRQENLEFDFRVW